MAAPLTRRGFLVAATAAVAGPTIIVRGARAAASERITLGFVGCGGMGQAHLRGFLGRGDVQVLAVCDPDRDRRAAARAAVERAYADATRSGTYRGCDDHADFRDLLARGDVDAFVVASPDHWHAEHVIRAVRAGKDVYGEKPLSLTVAQGRAMSDAVARTGRVFQTGSQQRSDARFRLAVRLVRNGRIGRVHRVICTLPEGSRTSNHPVVPVPEGFDYDLWLGPAPAAPYCPQRTHYVFRHILDYSGGILTDWGAHHVDIAQWALGRETSGPVTISGAGTFPDDGLWDAAVTYEMRARYEDGVELIVRSHPRENGVTFLGDAGWIFVSRDRLEVEPAGLERTAFAPGDWAPPPSDDHRANFLDCVRRRREPVAPIEHAHRTITIAHLGNIAMRLGRPLRWDPRRERVLDDPVATALLDRPARAGWAT